MYQAFKAVMLAFAEIFLLKLILLVREYAFVLTV